MRTFALPDLGEGLIEAELVAWHVSVGDHVVADQPLASVETAKALVEIPSPWSGHVARLHGAPGDVVRVGDPLVEFEEGEHVDTGALVGELERRAEVPPARPGEPSAKASPAVRARARELGIDLRSVAGTGPGGAVTLADLGRGGEPIGGAEPLSGVRRAMAVAMRRSGDEVVPASVTDDVDVDAWPPEADVTARLVRAIVVACRASPALNAWFDGRTLSRRLCEDVDLGIAVDTPDGLFVPVLRGAAALDEAGIRDALEAIERRVRERTIPLAELRGATITLSNFGSLGGRYGALTIVPPQVAILGAGRIASRPAVVDGAVVPRRLLPLSLTFDHRAVTGGEAARFLAAAAAELGRAMPS